MIVRRARILLAAVALSAALLALAPSGAPAAKRTRGVDVSRFQGVINWERVGKTRLRFAIVQASRGSGEDCLVAPERCGPDEFYESNYRGARAAGLRVGAYHRAFASGGGRRKTRRDARAEANVFIEGVGKLRKRDLLPALDVETPFVGLTERGLRRWLRVWLERVRQELGVRPMIYTNSSSWQATGDTTGFARRGHRLWVANWNVQRPSVPAEGWGGEGWSVWQYTSSGSVRGIKGRVDKNRARISLRRLSVG